MTATTTRPTGSTPAGFTPAPTVSGGPVVVATQDAATAAARFGQPTEWARYHSGDHHVCLDGRQYRGSCLVTDPAMEQVARNILARHSGPTSQLTTGSHQPQHNQ